MTRKTTCIASDARHARVRKAMPSVSAARNTPFRCPISSATSATKSLARPLTRWIWRPSPRRRPPCGANAHPGRDSPVAAAVSAGAAQAVRTDPAGGARVAVRPAAGRPPALRIRTHRGLRHPPRMLRARPERATRRQRIPTGADVVAAAAAVLPAARRIPAQRAPRAIRALGAIRRRCRLRQSPRSLAAARRYRGVAPRANAQCRSHERTEAPLGCHQ
jgi:hypothetical protein